MADLSLRDIDIVVISLASRLDRREAITSSLQREGLRIRYLMLSLRQLSGQKTGNYPYRYGLAESHT